MTGLVAVVALLCCVPGAATVGGMDANCGPEFDHECLDLSQPVFTVWPWAAGAVCVAAWLALWWIPRRLVAVRALMMILVVLPPLIVAVAAYIVVSRTGVV